MIRHQARWASKLQKGSCLPPRFHHSKSPRQGLYLKMGHLYSQLMPIPSQRRTISRSKILWPSILNHIFIRNPEKPSVFDGFWCFFFRPSEFTWNVHSNGGCVKLRSLAVLLPELLYRGGVSHDERRPPVRDLEPVSWRGKLCVVWVHLGIWPLGYHCGWKNREKPMEFSALFFLSISFADSQRATDLVQVPPPNSWSKGRKAESQQQFFLEGRGFVHHLRTSQVKFEPRSCVFLKIPIWMDEDPRTGVGLSLIYGNCSPEHEGPKFQPPNSGVCPQIFRQTHNCWGWSTVLPWFRLGRWAIWGAPAVTFASRRRTVPCSPQESRSSIVQILTIDM